MLNFRTSCFVIATLAAFTLPSSAVTPNQRDDFENGTTLNWQNGASNPNPATNVATGGPAGADDNFLRIASTGAGGGGRLVMFNSSQWTGDYLAAGVGAIQMQVNNLGATDLTLRLILVDSLDGQSLSTLAPVNLPASSGWTSVSFPLTPANLTGGSASTVLARVSELNLVHSPNPVTARSLAPNVVAQLGIDNITAVPEPTLLLPLLTLTTLVTSRRRRSPRAPS